MLCLDGTGGTESTHQKSEQPVARAVRQRSEYRLCASVSSDDVAGSRPTVGQCVVDCLHHLLDRGGALVALGCGGHESVDRVTVETALLVTQPFSNPVARSAALLAHWSFDRSWLDDRNLDSERAHLPAQRISDRLDRVLRGGIGRKEWD